MEGKTVSRDNLIEGNIYVFHYKESKNRYILMLESTQHIYGTGIRIDRFNNVHFDAYACNLKDYITLPTKEETELVLKCIKHKKEFPLEEHKKELYEIY